MYGWALLIVNILFLDYNTWQVRAWLQHVKEANRILDDSRRVNDETKVLLDEIVKHYPRGLS